MCAAILAAWSALLRRDRGVHLLDPAWAPAHGRAVDADTPRLRLLVLDAQLAER